MKHIRAENPILFVPDRRHVGRSFISRREQQLVIEVAVRKDRTNKGIGRVAAVNMIKDLKPNLSTKQAAGCYDRTVRPKGVAKGMLKASIQTAVPSTNLRTQVTKQSQ
jgi:hypothetical protein